jgi:peptidoglycan hydrolase CwlO-like protein
MPEPNGEIPLTGDAHVDAAIQRIRGKFRDLEDSIVVQAYLNRDTARLVKEMADRMDRLEHEQEREAEERKAKDAAEAQERKTRDADLDVRIKQLVSSIADLIGRIPPRESALD